jgi:hypothetical protein
VATLFVFGLKRGVGADPLTFQPTMLFIGHQVLG